MIVSGCIWSVAFSLVNRDFDRTYLSVFRLFERGGGFDLAFGFVGKTVVVFRE